jgi:hypothetical protein
MLASKYCINISNNEKGIGRFYKTFPEECIFALVHIIRDGLDGVFRGREQLK